MTNGVAEMALIGVGAAGLVLIFHEWRLDRLEKKVGEDDTDD